MLAYQHSTSHRPSPPFGRIDSYRQKTEHVTPRLANRSPIPTDAKSANKPLLPTIVGDEAKPTFSPLELLVINISEGDRRNLITGRRWAWLARLLFGIEVSRPLADPRLEALRVLAVSLRRSGTPVGAIEAALAAGVTYPQIEHLRSSQPRALED